MAKWTFSDAPVGMDQGPNNSTAEHFKSQDIFSALVRESIQNSLDVQLDKDKPVVVQYAFGSIDEVLGADIREIEEHVKAISADYPESSNYQRMAQFLNEHEDNEITYLRVSDYNTRGMDYEKDSKKCGFYSFVQSIGNSSKDSAGAGGSYGFGKAAYYEFSNSHSVLVSSRTPDGSTTFQGSAMLCTHKIGDKKYHWSGFFDDGNGEPIQNELHIPEKFRRHEPGSDIYLLHVNNAQEEMKNYEENIVRSVLLNFWLAIFRNKLEVLFDWQDDGQAEVRISCDTLDELMQKFFPNLSDYSDPFLGYCNPRPYYEAVKTAEPFDKNSETEQKCVCFKNDQLKHVGKVMFYLMRNEDTKDRYVRMRQRYMVIDAPSIRGQRGLSGVLVCEEGIANDTLRKAEPPAHDAWDIKRVEGFKNQPETDEGKAYKAIKALERYVRECIRDYFASNSAREVEIAELDNFLYATESFDAKNGNTRSTNGTISEGTTQDENGALTTKANGPAMVNKNPIPETLGTVTIITDDPKGEEPGGSTAPLVPPNTPTTPRPTPPQPGTNPIFPPVEPVIPGGDGPHIPQRKFMPVSFKILAKFEEDGLVYTAKIKTKEDIENAVIIISTQGEEGEEIIDLAWSQVGKIFQSSIRGVSLRSGVTNEVKFRFEDNIKHCISLVAYVTE
ncbi:MAG: hypothetical protein KBT28_11915 [Bacteroidales bacterium]|nr:hypothetical protein [Candidatus Colimorpha merdihippi]